MTRAAHLQNKKSRIEKLAFPLHLKLLDGLKWSGSLTVDGPAVDDRIGRKRWAVGFDAEITEGTDKGMFVYDRALLTAKQIEDWTGVKL
jgi:hypothetical protein